MTVLPSPSLALVMWGNQSLPPATVGYLALYLATLVLHVVFMGYVLAGSAYLAVVLALKKPDDHTPFEPLLREWLPFMLSLAITAGIAPLLFLQILYRPQFYTANVLLFHRWMAVVPVLIVGFYLLYLLKTRWGEQRSRWVPAIIAMPTAACFIFVAWSWTENHLLSLADQSAWSSQYVSESHLYRSRQLLPRLAMWFCGTFTILAVWLSWQVWWPHRPKRLHGATGTRRAAAIGLAGLIIAFACGSFYWTTMPDQQRAAVSVSTIKIPWLLVAIGGVGIFGLFVDQFRTRQLSVTRLLLLSLSVLLAITGAACLRESLRLHSVDFETFALHSLHESAAAISGRWVFAGFLFINAVLIGWCLRVALRPSMHAGSEAGDGRP